jgi:hypothetical protein
MNYVKFISGGLVGLRCIRTGEFILPHIYENLSYMNETEDYVRVKINNLYGVFSTVTKTWVLNPIYSFISLFHFEITTIKNTNNKTALYHKNLGFVTDFLYDSTSITTDVMSRSIYLEKKEKIVNSNYLLDCKNYNCITFI